MTKNKKRIIKAIIIAVISLAAVYLLFFLYVPAWGIGHYYTVELSEERLLRVCPEAMLTEYDREFLDTLYADPRVSGLERHESISVTAEELDFGYHRDYPDESYKFSADYHDYWGISANIQLEQDNGIYTKRVFLRIREKGDTFRYTKSITTVRRDGRFISDYRQFGDRYEKEVYIYGLVGYAIMNWHGILSA